MKTFLKILGGIVILFFIIILGLHLYFTNQRLKAMLIPRVEQAIGKKVVVHELSITTLETFPNIGLEVDQAYIPGEKNDTLASFNKLIVSLKIIPLLSRKIQISKVELIKPYFNYIVHLNGSSNLDTILKKFGNGPNQSAEPSTTIPLIALDDFEMKNADIGYINHPEKTQMRFHHMNMDLTLHYAHLINSTMNIDIGGLSIARNGSKYISNLPVKLTQESTVNLNNELIDLKKGQFSIRGLVLDINGQIKKWSSNAPNINLNFHSASNDFGALLKLVPASYQKTIKGWQTKGSFTLNGNVMGTYGGKNIPAFQISAKVKNGSLKNPDLAEPIENISADLIANNKEVKIYNFSAQAGENTIQASGNIKDPLKGNGPFSLNIKTKVNLGTVNRFYSLKRYEVESLKGLLTANVNLMGNANNMKNIQGSGNISIENGYLKAKRFVKPVENITLLSTLRNNQLDLKKLDMQSGENSLSMTGNVNNYLSKNPDVNLKINSKLKLDELGSYYDLRKYVKKMSGIADAHLTVTGPVKETQKLRFDGDMTLQNVNIESDSLPKPVRNLNVRLTFNQSNVNLSSLKVLYGKSDFNVNGDLKNYIAMTMDKSKAKSPSTLTGNYNSHFMDVDELMNWQANQQSDTASVPVNLPNLNSSVKASIDSMVVLGVPMTKMQAAVQTTPEQVTMPNGSVDMFGGKVNGSFIWKVPDPNRTHIQFQGKMDNLLAQKFFKEYPVLGKKSDFYKYVNGSFSAEASYQTDLNRYLDPVMKSTKAKGSFGMKKVRFSGNPIQKELAGLLKAPELENLTLDDWKADFSIDNGILTLKNVKLTSKDLGLSLNGTENLITNKLDYKLKVYLPERYGSKIASVIGRDAVKALTQKNKTIALPLAVKGTTQHPAVTIDQDVVKSILKDFLKNKLKGIFGN